MQRPNTNNLVEKPIKEQAQILWLAFEELTMENFMVDASEPTEEEINNLVMVLVMFASHLFEAILTRTTGHVRETIVKAWCENMQNLLLIGRRRDHDAARAASNNGTDAVQKKTDKDHQSVQKD